MFNFFKFRNRCTEWFLNNRNNVASEHKFIGKSQTQNTKLFIVYEFKNAVVNITTFTCLVQCCQFNCFLFKISLKYLSQIPKCIFSIFNAVDPVTK